MHTFFTTASLLSFSFLMGFSTLVPRATAQSQTLEPKSQFAYGQFLQAFCCDCHGEETQEGNLRLDSLPTDFSNRLLASRWAEVLNAINGREMPPEGSLQPSADKAAEFAQWLEAELARGEILRRSTQIVLRRMNRAEYNNTIRDLIGVDFHPADTFPEDPPAGGFDNNGEALTMSPLQMELYYQAARDILDRALFEGEQPETIEWRFEPEENSQGADRLRVNRGNHRILLNNGENKTEGDFTVIHHDAWNKGVGFRDFQVPVAGDYIIRFRAAGRIPSRDDVIASARAELQKRRNDNIANGKSSKEREHERVERELQHFRTDRMYDYGPPRVRIAIQLGGVPVPVAEMDIDAAPSEPKIYEVRTHFSTESAGVTFNNTYSVPRVLENFWMQQRDSFARPELMIDWIELEGPIHPVWPPESHTRLLPNLPAAEHDEVAYARGVLNRFMQRAYRRPLEAGELESKLALFSKIRSEKPSFIEAIKVPLAAVLTSPKFLYLIEPDKPLAEVSVAGGADDLSTDTARRLNQFEFASRLSYFLWSSMPDDELAQLAGRGQLYDPEVLNGQLDRMLADAKSEALVENFAGQWLGLRKVGANPPVESLYPRYDRHLEVSMVAETKAFFAEILRNDLDTRNLIKSDFVVINQRMARFYGIDGVKGDGFRRVAVPSESHRGGLITQASIHCITSNGTRTSPVTRGVWVLKTMLGTDPGLPVANVGEIPDKVPGIDKSTVRDRLQIHRKNPSCARCHNKIDPLGFALENFNACGEWRDQEGHGYAGRIGANDPVINARAQMPDGSEFEGVEGLQEQLLAKEDLFLQGLASQLTTYALGRELGFSDRATIRQHVSAMKENNYTLRSLIAAIVKSDQFISK
jgi:hypothetical protein